MNTSLPEKARTEKLLQIRLLQDQRRGAGSTLEGFLSDNDPVVRRHALVACGSIQDTLLLPVIMERLRDKEPGVSEAAAFAVGQTGLLLSSVGRTTLEKLCLDLWTSGEAPPRLLEEIGKFGSAVALGKYASRAQESDANATRFAMIMGVARFAIRGITDGRATRWLMGLVAAPDRVSWQTVYALQRIAPEQMIDPIRIRPLAGHHDPLVRMYAATLLGKVRDTVGGPAILLKLAAVDTDWRVRVNAIKALGMLGPRRSNNDRTPDDIQTKFGDLFGDKNEHVALSAIATFGEMMKGAKSVAPRVEEALWMIAENSRSRVSARRQAEAFGALGKVGGRSAFTRLSRVQPADEWTEARLLAAMGATGDTAALGLLLHQAEAAAPLLATAALEGLHQLASLHGNDRRILGDIAGCAIRTLDSRDIAVLSTAAGMLEDSLLSTPDAVDPLLRALERLRAPDDTEAMQQVIHTLGVLKDQRAVPVLERSLASSDPTVVTAAGEALRSVTGTPAHRPVIPDNNAIDPAAASRAESALPDTVLVRMRTSAGSMVLELYHDFAPFTVESFVRLVRERKFFDGLTFHRVVPNFVVQGGDPRGDGWGGPGYSIRSEFSLLRYERGTLGMASAGKDTEGSQFFITHSPQPHLDGRYTIFGRVRSGMDVVDRLQVGDRIERVSVETRGGK